jgi:hypothetical protein
MRSTMWMKINLSLCVACLATACATPPAAPDQDSKMTPDLAPDKPPLPHIAAKRRAPPQVAAVTLDGVRYEQAVLTHDEAGGGQRTGYLAAHGGTSDERLWRVRVYELQVDPQLEGDVQEVWFATMTASPGGHELLIANERGDRFAVDVRTRAVRKLD